MPKGQEKVETEGANGVMETTNLVTKSGGKVMSSNMIIPSGEAVSGPAR